MANGFENITLRVSIVVAMLVTVLAATDIAERERPANASGQSAARELIQESAGNAGVIRGRVTDAQSGAPSAGAEISVSCCAGSSGIRSTTGPDGGYEVRLSSPGEYVVTAKALGYVQTSFGQATLTSIVAVDDTPAIWVRVRAGQVTSDVDIRLQRSAGVNGRVFGDTGEALADIEVELLREIYQPGGAAPVAVAFGTIERVVAEQTMSGARFGTYRISGLPPGKYFVRAYATESVRPKRGGASVAYAPTFFPKATRLADAQPIVLRAGQELSNLDFTLMAVKTHVVSGRLLGQKGRSSGDTSVELVPVDVGSEASRPRANVAPDGRFQIRGVVPGNYVLVVADGTGGGRWVSVRRPLVVVADTRNLQIAPAPGARVEGRFVQDDGGPLQIDPQGIQVALDYSGVSDEPGARGFSIETRVAADGTFAIEGPAGQAALRTSRPSGAHLPSPAIAIKTIRMNGADVTDTPLDLAPGARARIEIVVASRAAAIAGTVRDERQQPAAYALVVMFPNDRLRMRASRLIRAAFADRDGRYEIEALAPADYRVVTLPSLPREAWKDPAVLERLWPVATPVRLGEGERRTLELRLSPAPADVVPAH
jgi:hypothetical protein